MLTTKITKIGWIDSMFISYLSALDGLGGDLHLVHVASWPPGWPPGWPQPETFAEEKK